MNLPNVYSRITPCDIHLWLVLLICSVGSLADVFDYSINQPGRVFAVTGLICFTVLKATVFTALFILSKRNRLLKFISILIIIGFIILSLLNGLCWLFYGFGISRKLFTILTETNRNELMEFLPELQSKFTTNFLSLEFIGCAIIYIILWKYLPFVPRKLFFITTSTFSVFGFIYFIYVFTTADFGRSNHIGFLRTYRCAIANIRNRKIIKELEERRQPMPDKETVMSTYKAKTVVVVLGESASRDHLSLYGYPLPTTPHLDTISRGLYIFTDAVASSTSTAENIPRLLTFMTDEPTQKEWYDYPTLLQLFHILGYRTHWLSNQERTGEMSNLSGILSSDADDVKYLGSQDSEDHYLLRYDNVILQEWRNSVISQDTLQLTFMHLMGSHFQYCKRYPCIQSKFTANDILTKTPRKWINRQKGEIVANYDNSIFYTDSILNELITDIRVMKQPALLVYVSDHGENVYDDRDYRGRDPKFVRVPFLIYANKAYQDENPEIIEELREVRSQSFSTSELPQILLHLTGTSYSYYDSIRDPLSPAFIPRIRYVDNLPFDDQTNYYP